ncbi:MAG TPA: sialate O-acetylesterase [Pseudomonadales bacterium]|nr:sialate O-acetylesterase [Pseudomonadales bacterium]
MKKIYSFLWVFFGGFFLLNAAETNMLFKLRLESPVDYQIFQRSSMEQGKLIVAGTFLPEAKDALPLDGLEARLTGKSFTGDVLSDKWQRLSFDARVASFRGALVAPAGGWYRLEVRALQQKTPLMTNTIEHVGIGEIFVIAGQSNSANYGEKKNQTVTGLVAAFNGTNWQLAADPEPGAGGKKGSFMPLFGDDMVEQFHVPIGIVAMGIGSTSVREWLPSGILFTKLPTLTRNVVTVGAGQWESSGKIFDTFAARMKQLGPNGFRAVLWHQGESDANQGSPQNTLPGGLYRQYLEQIILQSRREIGWNAPWFVAQVSYHNPDDTGTPDIPAAQKAVCDDGFAFPGPDTDVLTGQMREKNGEGIHLSAAGLKEHAQLWMDKVAPWLQRQLEEPSK